MSGEKLMIIMLSTIAMVLGTFVPVLWLEPFHYELKYWLIGEGIMLMVVLCISEVVLLIQAIMAERRANAHELNKGDDHATMDRS